MSAGGAELILAAVAVPDLCIRYGKAAIQIYRAIRHADEQIKQRILRVESCWARVECQIGYVQSAASVLTDNQRRLHDESTEVLLGKLKTVHSKLARVVRGPGSLLGSLLGPSSNKSKPAYDDLLLGWDENPGEPERIITYNRLMYPILKESIDLAIEEMEKWQALADPSIFLTLRVPNPQIDTALGTGPSGNPGTADATMRYLPSAIPLRDTVLPLPSRPGFGTSYPSNGGGVASQPQKIFLPESELTTATIFPIRLCNAQVAQRQGSSKFLLLDKMVCPDHVSGSPNALQAAKRDIRDLARQLQHIEPSTMGFLALRGVVQGEEPAGAMPGPAIGAPTTTTTTITTTNAASLPSASGVADAPTRRAVTFTMVFRMPASFNNPQSLRGLLHAGERLESLSYRLRIAMDMAKAVSYVHALGFVHKNVRPETVLVLQPPRPAHGSAGAGAGAGGPAGAPSSYLIGFDSIRREDARTYRRGDDDWEKNLYRHPFRQGASPTAAYAMQHDIYSLGVVLLEVGLWESFVRYDDNGRNPRPSPRLDVPLDDTAAAAGGGGGGGGAAATLQRPLRLKDRFVNLAKNRLPASMGSRYAEIVETCLTCLDSDNEDFGDEKDFQDDDGILVGVRYIEKVLGRLNTLCI